jgi:hypothetical protein
MQLMKFDLCSDFVKEFLLPSKLDWFHLLHEDINIKDFLLTYRIDR